MYNKLNFLMYNNHKRGFIHFLYCWETIDTIEDIRKYDASLLVKVSLLIFFWFFFVTAYNLTQHQDVENHMLPGERQTTSSKELDFRAKCQGRGMVNAILTL